MRQLGLSPKEISNYASFEDYLDTLAKLYAQIKKSGEDLFFFDTVSHGRGYHLWNRILTLLPSKERPVRQNGSVGISEEDSSIFQQRYLNSLEEKLSDADKELLEKVKKGEIPIFPYTRIHAGELLHAEFLGHPKAWDAITVEGLETLIKGKVTVIFGYEQNY